MRICDLNSGVGQLTQAFADLKDRWKESKEKWNDDVRRHFEQNQLNEIPARLTQLLGAAGRLAEVLDRAAKDCGDHEEASE